MGIPTEFANYTEDVIIWRKTVVVNDDNLTPVRKLGLGESFNQTTGTNIVSNIDFDFTERIYDIQYYGILDVLAKLGGLRASILPIVGYFAPLLTLHFLYTLGGIVDQKIKKDNRMMMLKVINVSRK